MEHLDNIYLRRASKIVSISMHHQDGINRLKINDLVQLLLGRSFDYLIFRRRICSKNDKNLVDIIVLHIQVELIRPFQKIYQLKLRNPIILVQL